MEPPRAPSPRPVILTFVRYYLPGFKAGGPVRTIANLVDTLGDELDFRIVTSDRDLLDSAPFPDLSRDAWNRVGKASVYYSSPGRRGIGAWARLIRRTPHDLLYLNSLVDPIFALRPLAARWLAGGRGRPIVIAPRGELSPGALALKRWKKGPFLALASGLGLYRHVLWHASTEEEARLIRRRFGAGAKCVVARNLPPVLGPPPSRQAPRGVGEPLRMVFLSRIARMKNLDYALRVLQRCPARVRFDIWGSQEDAPYWAECQRLIRGMPGNVAVEYRGLADHSRVIEIIADYDLFFLPSRGENYGHVIAEAVSAGTPLLLSDRTPWRDLAAQGVGWDLPLEGNEAAFVEAIESAAERAGAEGARWRKRVHEYAVKVLADPELTEANRSLFALALESRGGQGAAETTAAS